MARIIKKCTFVAHKLKKKIESLHAKGETSVNQTWSRWSTITPIMIRHTIAVHNGLEHIPVFVTDQMVGHKLGEFSPTRSFRGHAGAKNKGKK